MVAVRTLRQPEAIDYPPLTPVQKLDAQINQRFDALMATCDEPLTDDQWRCWQRLSEARRLLEWGMLSEAADVLAKAVAA